MLYTFENKENETQNVYSHNVYSIVEVLLGMNGVDEFSNRDQDEELELEAAILHYFNYYIKSEGKLIIKWGLIEKAPDLLRNANLKMHATIFVCEHSHIL